MTEQQQEHAMRAIGAAVEDFIHETVGREFGFALMVFRIGEGDRCDFLSNADREGAVALLRSMADQLEARAEIPYGTAIN